MTRTDLTATSRPQTVEAVSKSGSSRPRVARRLIAVPVVLALLAPTAPALAASYNQTPTPPTTTTTTTTTAAPTPSNGTGPSTSSSPATPESTTTPKSSTSPSTPAASPAPAKSSTLPFTGLDLQWVVAGGLLLMAGGLSIRLVQRKQGSGIGR